MSKRSVPSEVGGISKGAVPAAPGFSFSKILARVVDRVAKATKDDSMFVASESGDRMSIPYWISTGAPDLDHILGGGVAGGRVCEMFSNNESEGKSTTAATIARECQRMGGVVVWFDTEMTAMPEHFKGFGLDLDDRLVFSFAPNLEAIFEQISAFAAEFREAAGEDAPVLFVIDSVAATVTAAQEDSEFAKQQVAMVARCMSQSLPKLVPILKKTRSTLLLVNQSRTKIGTMWGDPNETPGGRAMKFYASQRIALRRVSKITADGSKEGSIVGIEVEAHTVKNKVASPFRKTRFNLLFSGGIDEASSAFDLLVRTGVVTGGAGGRYTVPFREGTFFRKEWPSIYLEPGVREAIVSAVAVGSGESSSAVVEEEGDE